MTFSLHLGHYQLGSQNVNVHSIKQQVLNNLVKYDVQGIFPTETLKPRPKKNDFFPNLDDKICT